MAEPMPPAGEEGDPTLAGLSRQVFRRLGDLAYELPTEQRYITQHEDDDILLGSYDVQEGDPGVYGRSADWVTEPDADGVRHYALSLMVDEGGMTAFGAQAQVSMYTGSPRLVDGERYYSVDRLEEFKLLSDGTIKLQVLVGSDQIDPWRPAKASEVEQLLGVMQQVQPVPDDFGFYDIPPRS